jgi:SAM-dependent methyltransferase
VTAAPRGLGNADLISTDEAIRRLRQDPACSDLIRDAYLGRDVRDSARRFAASDEFAEVLAMIGDRLARATLVDMGAGTGIASFALSAAGAGRVIAIEPDGSDEVGRGAMARGGVDVEVLAAFAEDLPLDSGSVDIVYARQVLHHAADLEGALREIARVLRAGGLLLACREHVVDDDTQLSAFLEAHPVHQLAGGENAYPLSRYRSAIRDSGLALAGVLGPWDSIINAFPSVRSSQELRQLPVGWLERRFGRVGWLAGHVPIVRRLVLRKIDQREPGRLYTFVAHKP